MAAPEDNENCHHAQNDPQRCKIKLQKFPFNIFWCYRVIKEIFPGGGGRRQIPFPTGGRVKGSMCDEV